MQHRDQQRSLKYPDVPKWSEHILSVIRQYNAISNLQRILECDDVDKAELLLRLTSLRWYRPDTEQRKYTKREATNTVRCIREVAHLIQNLNDHRTHGIALQGSNRHLTEALPDLLRDYAQRVEKLPDYVQEKWEPVKVAAISQVIWYVYTKTGAYHDEDVAAIIGAFLFNGEWTADALKQWRKPSRCFD